MAFVVFYPIFVDAVDLDILQLLSVGKTKKEVSHYLCSEQDRPFLDEMAVEKRLILLKDLFSCRTDKHLIAFCIRNHIIL